MIQKNEFIKYAKTHINTKYRSTISLHFNSLYFAFLAVKFELQFCVLLATSIQIKFKFRGWIGILNALSIQFRMMHKPVYSSKDTKIFSFTELQAASMFTNDTSEFTQSYIHVKKCHISSWCMCALKTCFTRVWYCANNIVTQHCITPVLFGFSSKSYNQMPGGLIILNDKSKQQYSLNRVREIHSCSSNWSQQIALSCLRALKILQYTVIWEWWNDKTVR